MTLLDLLGRKVIDAEGKDLGRVYDVVAERDGDDLAIRCLLVGPGAWRVRFGVQDEDEGTVVEWDEIERLDEAIRLRRGAPGTR